MPNAMEMLHQDHEKVSDLFTKAMAARDHEEKWDIFDKIASELEIHAALEEEIFYPSARKASGRDALVDDSLRDHRLVKDLVSQMRLIGAADPEFDTLLQELHSSVEAHVAMEESDLFPTATSALGGQADDIGTSLMTRKTQLKTIPPLTKSIEVNAPTHDVYEQWTHFEEFPQFMEGVKEVRKIDQNHMHWRAEVAGRTEEWDAEVDQAEPDKRIVWHSITGSPQSGRVSFRAISPSKTRVLLEMVYKPEGVTENLGAALGVLSSRVEGDLKRFKQMVESHHHPM